MSDAPQPESSSKEIPQQENLMLNLGMNLILPVLILNKGKDWLDLSPSIILVVALAFPLGYGIYDFATRKKFNFFSIIGFVSVLLTGGIGLMELDNRWLAIKEAAIPGIFAIVIAGSAFTRKPLVKAFMLNPELMDVDRIDKSIHTEEDRLALDKLLTRGTWYLAASFVVSAILNYVLATMIVTSAPGTDAYNAELGKLQLVSFGVIMIPSMIMLGYTGYYIFSGIKKLTGLGLEDLFYQR
ncbi:MAG: VC0807 family protein [Opitutales bacterium]